MDIEWVKMYIDGESFECIVEHSAMTAQIVQEILNELFVEKITHCAYEWID